MRYLLIILSLFIWSCEEQGPEEVVVDIFNYDKNIMMQFSHNIDINQFNYTLLDSGVYFISNPQIFGMDCNLFYDDNKRTLAGYKETTVMNGFTGSECYPLYINELEFSNGYKLNQDFEIIDSDFYTIPNPYLASAPLEDEGMIILWFEGFTYDARLDIFNGNNEKIQSLLYNDSFGQGNIAWNLRDTNNIEVPSGSYYYEIINAETEQLLGNSSTIIIRNQE